MVFWSFRVMLAVGGLMCLIAFWATYELFVKHRTSQLLLTALSWMTFSGWVAVLAGWYVTEVGRQPFIIYGLLRVEDVVADHFAGTVLGTFVAYVSLYVFLLFSYIATLRHLALKPARSLSLLHEYAQQPSETL